MSIEVNQKITKTHHVVKTFLKISDNNFEIFQIIDVN